jgi:hypothetical protein
MGCYAYSVYVSGIKFNLKDSVRKIKNPNFGKYKFDPENGTKIEEFTTDKKLYHEMKEFLDNEYENCFVCYDFDGTLGITFYGYIIKMHTENSEHKKIPDIKPKPEKYNEILKILVTNNIPFEEGEFVVGHLSC